MDVTNDYIVQNDNLKLMDIIKLIMAILVISLHTLPLIGMEDTLLYKLWWSISQITVPFFFLATGYMISYKVYNGGAICDVLKKSILRYSMIYIIWSAIYSPLAIIYYIKNKYSVKSAILNYIKEFFLSGQHYNSWILWYILSSIYAFVAVWVLVSIIKNRKWLIALSVLSMVMYSVLHVIKGSNDVIPSIRLLNGCMYIPIGILLFSFFHANRKKLALVINFSALILSIYIQYQVVNNRILLDLLTVIIAVTFFYVIIKCKIHIKMETVIFRKISVTVYYLHLYIWTIYYFLVYKEKHFGMDSFIVVTLIVLMIGILWNKPRLKIKGKN